MPVAALVMSLPLPAEPRTACTAKCLERPVATGVPVVQAIAVSVGGGSSWTGSNQKLNWLAISRPFTSRLL